MPSLGQLENGSTALANTNIANNPAMPAPTNQYANPNPTPINPGGPGGFNPIKFYPGGNNTTGKFGGIPLPGPVIGNPTPILPVPAGAAPSGTLPPGVGPWQYATTQPGAGPWFNGTALSALGQPGSMSANSPVSPTVGLLGIGNFASPQ
jgi:hypothetical protein